MTEDAADWRFALATVLPERVEPTPQAVVKYIRGLHRQVKELQDALRDADNEIGWLQGPEP